MAEGDKTFAEQCEELGAQFRKVGEELIKPFNIAMAKFKALFTHESNNSRKQRGLPPRRRFKR